MSANGWLQGALDALSEIEDKARTDGPEEAAALAGEFVGALAALVAQFNAESLAGDWPDGLSREPLREAFRTVARDRVDWPILRSAFKNHIGTAAAGFPEDTKAPWAWRSENQLFAALEVGAGLPFNFATKADRKDEANYRVQAHLLDLYDEFQKGLNDLPALPPADDCRDKILSEWRDAVCDRICYNLDWKKDAVYSKIVASARRANPRAQLEGRVLDILQGLIAKAP